MKEYKEFQFAWWMFITFVLTQLFILATTLARQTNLIHGSPTTILIVFFIIAILFYGMTTKIDSKKISIRYGVGLIRKNIDLNKIKSVKVVRNHWSSGWGIRLIQNGMSYNIQGLNGVELAFFDTDRIIRIGTKDSVLLKTEIERHIRH